MKVALSGMILGASMLGANAAEPAAETYTFANADGSQGGTITADGSGISGPAGMTCEAAPDHGTAYPGYSLGDSLAEHELGKTLAFFCGIDGQVIDDARGAPHSGDKILLKLDGTATDCGPKEIKDSSSASGGSVGARLFKPTLSVDVEYKCILGKGAAGPSVGAALKVKAISDASSIVSADPSAVSLSLTRSGAKTFSASEEVLFDLGTNKPHSAYYTSDGTTEGCATDADGNPVTGDPCLGAIHLTSTGFTHRDVSSDLAGPSWASDSSVPYFGFSAAACSTDERTQSPGISEFDACGLSKAEKVGASGLLTKFSCPFDASTIDALGTEANVDTCLAAGKLRFLDNKCGDRTWNTVENKNLANGFSVNLKWNDPAYKAGPPTNNVRIVGSSTRTLGAGVTHTSWTITDITDVAGVQGLYVQSTSGTSFSQPVTVSGGSVTVTQVPISVTELQLKGSVLLRTGCAYTDSVLSNEVDVAASAPGLTDGGEFTMADPCNGKFTYSLGADQDVSGIHAPGKDVTIKFCGDAESAAACKVGSGSASETENTAVIEGACDNVHAGDVGALIEITGKSPAPVVCPGACKAVDLGKVKLDWSVDFALSLSDGAGNRLLVEQEGGSSYEKENSGVSKTSHLASFNQCGADGKVYGTAAAVSPAIGSVASCAVDFSSLDKASEFVELFQKCGGATSSDSPSVYLISGFVVNLVDGSKLHFCNAKVLSIQQEAMQGESTSSVGIVAETADAADAMTAAFSFIGYQACDGADADKYKLVATMDVDTDASNVILADDTGTFAQLDAGDSSASYDAVAGVLTFETVCADVCSVGGAYDDQYDLNATLTGENSAELDIDAQIEVEGTPCGVTDDNIDRGSVDLSLYGVDNINKANTGAVTDCSSASASTDQSDITPDNNDLCASINVTGMGSGDLSIVSERLTRKSPGSAAEAISGDWFTATSYANGEHKSAGGRVLEAEDALTTYTLTIVWEQALSRRLLRTTHVFGAGEKSAESSVFILPASAQIEDAAGSIEAASEEGAEEPAEDAEEDSGLSGGAIAGIIAGGVVVAGGIAYAAVAAQGGRQRTSAPQYSAVRRSERFSTMNF